MLCNFSHFPPSWGSRFLSSLFQNVQRLQNAAARLVSNVAKNDHITPTLVKLHWLPVQFRVIFKIAMLAHTCIYGNAPEYLRGLAKVKRTSRYNLRSDGGMLLEDYSAQSKKTLGDRAFKTATPINLEHFTGGH